MHPGNRMPSVSMSIILIGFLFLVGYLNTNVSKDSILKEVSSKAFPEKIITAANQQQVDKSKQLTVASAPVRTGTPDAMFISPQVNNRMQKDNAPLHLQNRNNTASLQQTIKTTEGNFNTQAGQNENEHLLATNNTSESTFPFVNKTTNIALLENSNKTPVVNTDFIGDNNIIIPGKESDIKASNLTTEQQSQTIPAAADDNNSKTVVVNTETKEADIAAAKENTEAADKKITVKSNNTSLISQSDKAWMEDFAMHNKPAAKKWAGKLGLQAYITPSVVYRKLHNNAANKMLAGSTNSNYNNYSTDDAVTHKASFGVEAGVSLQYAFAKRLKLKAGMQLNYTRYNAHAFATNHPIATSITMNADDDLQTYEVFKTSDYSNTFGLSPAKLHNETYQLSIPIGADFKLASVDNFSLYAGATIQPTLLLYGKSYIISTDRRSYVQDPSLLNRFNLNAGFEMYVSYKTQDGYTWQLGPQYRAQIFSTNTKLYSVEERLQNFGFKIGLTKQL